MNLTKIKEGSIILAPSYLHTSIREALLQTREGIGGITITSFSSYFSTPQEQILFTYYARNKEKASSYVYHQDNCTRIAFLQEMMECISTLKEGNIDPASLPATDAYGKELKEMITSLYTIPTTKEEILQNVRNMQDASHLYILDLHTNVYEETLYQTLQAKGATRLQIQGTPSTKEFYHALNKRQEVESCCQYIIENKLRAEDIRMTLLDSSYIPYIHMVMDRYQIPYTITQEKEMNPITAKYIALLAYYLNPCVKTSCDLLLQHVFTHPHEKECLAYMQLFDVSFASFFHLDYQKVDETIASMEKKYVENLETKAWEVKETIEESLHTLTSAQGMDVLYTIDTLLCKYHTFMNKEDRKALFHIRSSYEALKTCYRDAKELVFFLSYLKQQDTTRSTPVQGVTISSLQKPTMKRAYHIVLGATQNNYPAFTSKQGIFDEDFYASVHYPSQQVRYEHHMQQVENAMLACEHLVVFYCFSTLDGKAQEASLEMETLLGTRSSLYPLQQVYKPTKRVYAIEPEQAISLYTKDKVLQGSISSIERYVNCPYAYFLRYGLQLYDPVDVSFNVAKAGSLAHQILETLTCKYAKDYPSTTQEEVVACIQEKIQSYVHLYPNQEIYFKQHTPRIIDYVMKNLVALHEHESHSSLQPWASEYKFTYPLSIDGTYTLQLRGVIDRIDANATHFRIVDFKSSPKTISENEIFNATKLQLVTYACIMEEVLQKRALGSFYYSLANPNTSMYYAKVKKRPLSLVFTNEDNVADEIMKNKRLSGLVYSESISVCDDNGSHTKGVSMNKDGIISARTIYNPQVLSQTLKRIYQLVANDILRGHIACEPSSDACLYCPYASICKKNNVVYEKPPLVEVDETLYLKGGKKHD